MQVDKSRLCKKFYLVIYANEMHKNLVLDLANAIYNAIL